MHKVILRLIQTHLLTLSTGQTPLLTLAMEFWTKNYWVAGPSEKYLSCLRRQTRRLDWHHRRFWHMQWRKSLRKRRQATRGLAGLRGTSAGLSLIDKSQFPLQFTVEWANIPPQIKVTVLDRVNRTRISIGATAQSVASALSRIFTIYGNLLPRIW